MSLFKNIRRFFSRSKYIDFDNIAAVVTDRYGSLFGTSVEILHKGRSQHGKYYKCQGYKIAVEYKIPDRIFGFGISGKYAPPSEIAYISESAAQDFITALQEMIDQNKEEPERTYKNFRLGLRDFNKNGSDVKFDIASLHNKYILSMFSESGCQTAIASKKEILEISKIFKEITG